MRMDNISRRDGDVRGRGVGGEMEEIEVEPTNGANIVDGVGIKYR